MAIKNPKQLSKKSRTHTVRHLSSNSYLVTSGHSGNEYTVRIDGNSGYCSCKWSEYRPASDRRSACSHVLATFDYIAAEGGRKVSAWGSHEDAKRQHRPVASIGDGCFITSRVAS